MQARVLFLALFCLALILGGQHPTAAQEDTTTYAYEVRWAGQWIFVTGRNGLWVFDSENLEAAPRHYFEGNIISAAALEPVRDRMAVYNEDVRTLYIIEPASGDIIVEIPAVFERFELDEYEFVYDVQYSDDGKLLAVGFDEHLVIFDALTNRQRQWFEVNVLLSLDAGIETGTFIGGLLNGNVVTFDIQEEIFPSDSLSIEGVSFFEAVYRLELLPDSAAGIALNGASLLRFDLASTDFGFLAPEFEADVRGFDINTAGDLLAAGMDEKTVIYDLTTSSVLLEIPTSEDEYIFSVAFNADATQLVTLNRAGRLQIWDVATGTLITEFFQFDGGAGSPKWG